MASAFAGAIILSLKISFLDDFFLNALFYIFKLVLVFCPLFSLYLIYLRRGSCVGAGTMVLARSTVVLLR